MQFFLLRDIFSALPVLNCFVSVSERSFCDLLNPWFVLYTANVIFPHPAVSSHDNIWPIRCRMNMLKLKLSETLWTRTIFDTSGEGTPPRAKLVLLCVYVLETLNLWLSVYCHVVGWQSLLMEATVTMPSFNTHSVAYNRRAPVAVSFCVRVFFSRLWH